MADKNPQQFYNRVLNQDIKKYNVKMRGKLTFIMTQRPLLKIITSIKDKIIERIGEQIGKQYSEDIANAFAPGGNIEGKLLDMVENQQIDLLDENNVPLLQK